MNVIIHGAVNSSNFGDCLYAQIYNEYVKELNSGINVFFWGNRRFGASNHLKKISEINTTKHMAQMDALIYMPGGYFSEGSNLYRILKQYIRFFRIGENFIKDRKAILISGVGGEYTQNSFLRKKMCCIMNSAQLITTRNDKTADFFEQYVQKDIFSLFDVILHIKKLKMQELPDSVNAQISACGNKQKIFLHVHAKNRHNRTFEEKVIPSLNRYLENHDAHVFVGSDYVCSKDVSSLEIYKRINGNKSVYKYRTPMEMCSFLSNMDLVVTPKLHVGVVSCSMKKSVLSFAVDPTKTKAFYEDIGYEGRSVALRDCNSDMVYEQLMKYAGEPIIIPDDLYEKAEKNLDLLKETILELQASIEK